MSNSNAIAVPSTSLFNYQKYINYIKVIIIPSARSVAAIAISQLIHNDRQTKVGYSSLHSCAKSLPGFLVSGKLRGREIKRGWK
jgi:hypothetical protein